MATGLEGFADHLKNMESKDFTPAPYYEPETDSLIYYFRDERSYGHRVNKYFTLFLSAKDDTLVGIEVKGLKTIMKAVEGLGDVDLVKDVKVKATDGDDAEDLSVIVRCALVPDGDPPVSGERYEELHKATRGVPVPREKLGA